MDGEVGRRLPPHSPPSWTERARQLAIVLALLVGSLIFARTVHSHYPIASWLVWRYAIYWTASLVFALACLSAGHLVVARLVRVPVDQHLVLSFAAGVLVFFLGMFFGGLAGLYRPWFAIVWPLTLILAGGPKLYRHAKRRIVLVRARSARLAGVRWGSYGIWAFGLAGVGMVYFLILTPDNIAYDAQWYHLPIAEHYAAQGAVRPFVEGWYQGALPHLASFLYTWAFLLPKTLLFDRIEIAAHLEFVIFLATLAGIPPLVRWLIPGCGRVGASWAALFLFPGLLLYDSTLSLTNDHVAACFAIPIYLALARAWRDLAPPKCILLGSLAAAAMLVKYQALALVVFPLLAIFTRMLFMVARQGMRPWLALRGPLWAAVALAALTAPHWLKNWIWYGDPAYPFFHHLLAVRPWTVDSANLVEQVFRPQIWKPQGSLTHRLWETLRTLFTFSFRPNDWPVLHGKVPVFGSLFTLSLLALPFLRGTRRLWGLVLCAHAGLFVWYWTHHQDRYLQALLPWMAAAVAAAIMLIWRTGREVRLALCALIGLQILWGGDVYFLPTHVMPGGTSIKATVDLLSSGLRKDSERFERLGAYYEVSHLLPADAKVLVHEDHIHLGLGRMSVSDWGGWQGGLSYGRTRSPRDLVERLHEMGVTHIVWRPGASKHWDSLAGDLRFFGLVGRFAQPVHPVAELNVAPLPDPARVDPKENETVLYLGCDGTYEAGLYQFADLTVPALYPRDRPPAYPPPRKPLAELSSVEQALQDADYLIRQAGCPRAIVPGPSFVLAAYREPTELWIKR